MRLHIVVLAIAVLAPSARASQPPWSNVLDVGATIADKNLHLSGNLPSPQLLFPGDNIPTAIPISGLPFLDSRNSCNFRDDYDVACPYGYSTSPDVVYQYVPAANQRIDVDLCPSMYDTKVYIFDGSPATVVACNDDAGCGFSGYQSRLVGVPLSAGHTYYIVVDGYGGDCGTYQLSITEHALCAGCASYDQPEGEPDCFDGFVDNFNGGCNSSPPVFSPVGCGTICGTAGTYLFNGLQYRDTDWYELTVGPGNFTYTGVGDGFDLQLLVLASGCPTTVLSGVVTPSCQPATLNFTGPGTFYLWAGTANFSGVPCGSPYRLDINGPGIVSCLATPAMPTSWGALKIRYR